MTTRSNPLEKLHFSRMQPLRNGLVRRIAHGLCQCFLRLDGDQALHRPDFARSEEHVWNVDLFFPCTSRDQQKVRRAKPENFMAKEIIATLFEEHAARIVALFTAPDYLFNR